MLNEKEYIYSFPESDMPHKNNLIPFINYHKEAPKRCLDMLLAKYKGEPFQSEVIMEEPEKCPVPYLGCRLEEATILLVTDGGLVPKGNPDKIPSTNAGKYGVYSIEGKKGLSHEEYEVSHQGYDTTYVEENPNRLLPVDILRELEEERRIGELYDSFISTAGVMTSTEKSICLGKKIANYVVSHPIDAVLIASACGTSTRCGAYIGKKIEEKGIPVVQVTNLTQISADIGIRRIIKGNNICYPCGNPLLSEQGEYVYRRQLLENTLELLEEMPK